MELCLITPQKHVDQTWLLPGRFCIAPWAMASDHYCNFFAQAKNVILDNGVFENDLISDEDYFKLIQKIKPAVVIAPDTICGDASKNLSQGIIYAKKLKARFPEVDVMFVPQCVRGDYLGFETALQCIRELDEITWIGICRDAVYNAYGAFTQTTDQELNRLYFASFIQQSGLLSKLRAAGKKFHFLGVGDQVHLIQYYWFVDSMDTASFFWNSQQGIEMVNGILETRVKRPKDYFTRPYRMSYEAEQRIEMCCRKAQCYAQKATALRNQIENGRL